MRRHLRLSRGASGTLVPALALSALLATAQGVHAQFAEPCGVACALTLGASSVVFGSGTAAAVGRARGGYSTLTQGIVVWTAGFTTWTATGIAHSGDGRRQRRMVYSAGLGALGGSLAGLAAESLIGESTAATRVAATLIGAAVGIAVGGAIGTLTYEKEPGAPVLAYTLTGPSWSIPVGF